MNLRTLARADTPTGEVALRERAAPAGPVHELIVNGAFAMDSVDSSSELALAECVPVAGRRVLVGGLGLGYTARRLLELGAARVEVVEQAEPLIDWARRGLTPTLARVAGDPRVTLTPGRVQDALAPGAGWDVFLLDVVNGPGFLILESNRALYREGLPVALAALVPGGDLVIWSESASPELLARLRSLDAGAEELLLPIRREGREFSYALYRARRPGFVGDPAG